MTRSRSNSRKQALQLLFSYEFDIASRFIDYLPILCSYFSKTHVQPQGYDATQMDHDQFLELLEHQILRDISFYFLIQNNSIIATQNLEPIDIYSHQRYLQSWLSIQKPSYEEVISFIQDQIQQYTQKWFPEMSIYFWNARLQSLQDTPNISILTTEQQQIYHSLCDQDVQEMYAYIICQNADLHHDFIQISNFCVAPRLIAYWICTYQSSLLEELRSYPMAYEWIGTQIQKVTEGQMQLSQLQQYLNSILKQAQQNKSISEVNVTGNYTSKEDMSPILELEDDVDWGGAIPTIEEIQYAETLIQGVLKQWNSIDQKIHEASVAWPMNRMTHIDRTILRIGVFELLFCSKDVPAKVVIDESLHLSHAFAEQGSHSNKSSKFVNGILDRIARDHDLIQ